MLVAISKGPGCGETSTDVSLAAALVYFDLDLVKQAPCRLFGAIVSGGGISGNTMLALASPDSDATPAAAC